MDTDDTEVKAWGVMGPWWRGAMVKKMGYICHTLNSRDKLKK